MFYAYHMVDNGYQSKVESPGLLKKTLRALPNEPNTIFTSAEERQDRLASDHGFPPFAKFCKICARLGAIERASTFSHIPL